MNNTDTKKMKEGCKSSSSCHQFPKPDGGSNIDNGNAQQINKY